MENTKYFRELLRNDSFEITQVLSELQIDAFVCFAQLKDPLGNSIVNLALKSVVLRSVLRDTRQYCREYCRVRKYNRRQISLR